MSNRNKFENEVIFKGHDLLVLGSILESEKCDDFLDCIWIDEVFLSGTKIEIFNGFNTDDTNELKQEIINEINKSR